jgi:hypothetical protein
LLRGNRRATSSIDSSHLLGRTHQDAMTSESICVCRPTAI